MWPDITGIWARLADDYENDTFLASLVESKASGVRSLAEWRWGTLASVLRSIADFVRSFLDNFTAEPLKKARDKKLVNDIVSMAMDGRWRTQYNFISWFMGHMEAMQQFGATCWCHRRGYEQGLASII